MSNTSRVDLRGWSDRDASWDKLAARIAAQSTEPVITLDLLRHGETTRNAEGLISGATDVPLTPHGRQQARDAGSALRSRYDVAFSSQLERSVETLALALEAARAKADARVIDRRLAERSLGDLEGLPSRPFPAWDAGDLTWAPPRGENYLVVVQRILSFLLDLRDAVTGTESPTVLVCSHMGPMRILVAAIGGVADATEALAGGFVNARVIQLQVGRVPWPGFLAR